MSTRDVYKAELDELLAGFARNVRRLRAAKGYSQEDLRLEAELDRTSIGKYERALAEPQLSTMLILASTLGCTLDELVEGLPVPKERRPSATKTARSMRAGGDV